MRILLWCTAVVLGTGQGYLICYFVLPPIGWALSFAVGLVIGMIATGLDRELMWKRNMK